MRGCRIKQYDGALERQEMNNPTSFPSEKAVAVEAVGAQPGSLRYPRRAIGPVFLPSHELDITLFSIPKSATVSRS